MPNLFFDHCYTADPGHRYLKLLEKLGFELRPSTVEHPGKHFCRFIGFNSPGTPRNFVYLEFIHIGRGGEAVRKPGLSLSTDSGMERFYGSLQKRSPALRAEFFHKNYEWKKDDKSRLPGWNFVSFRGLPFRTLYPWLTEYEKVNGKPRTKVGRIRHANGANTLLALELTVNAAGERFFERLLRRKIAGTLHLGPQALFFTRGKRTKLKRVILEAASLAVLRKHRKHVREATWNGREALVIPNPSGMWEVWVVKA